MLDKQGKIFDSEARPEVSIIIPAFNSANYIGEALDSVFAQTFDRYEVIVINDGSPDTEALEQELKRFPTKLCYIKQENRGAAAARNTGLRAARGELVAFLDADDTYQPNFLEKQIELLKRSNAELVFCDAMLFGDSPSAGRTFMELQPSRGEVTSETLLSIQVTVLTSTVLARKAPILKVGLFDESLRRGQDFDLWWRLAKSGTRFAYHNDVLAHHRIVESGLSGGTVSQLQRTLTVLEAIKARNGLTPGEKAALEYNLRRTLRELALEDGKEKLLGRDFAGARQAFDEARKLRAGWKLLVVCFGLRIAPEMLRWVYQRRELTPGRAG